MHYSAAASSTMDEEALFFPSSDTDLDLSFTSCASTDRTTTTTTTSARTSLARSSLTLSFNDRLSTTVETYNTTSSSSFSSSASFLRSHRRSSDDPHLSAIKAATTLSSDGALHLRHLKLIRHLGTGNLGRVFLCRLRDYDDHANANFALKVVDKESLSAKKLSHVKTEAEILSTLDHPFLPTLYAHIEVSHYTCLLIDYCPGGDLHALLRRQPGNRLPLKAVKFFASEVLVALEYLHSLGIVYRDLKPENILLREDGHIMLSDFDLCFKAEVVPTLVHYTTTTSGRRRRPSCFGEKQEEVVTTDFVAEPTAAFSRSCVGTHEYLAPELVAGNGHGNGVDWWAFGVLIYELAYGTTPFKGGSKESTLRNIASTRDVRFPDQNDEEERGEEMSFLRDLVEKLLVKDPRRRLGCARGAADVKRHPFFKGIKWALIRNYKAPEVRGLSRKTTMTKTAKGHVTGHRRRRFSRWLMNWKGSAVLGCYRNKKPCRFLHV